MRVLVTVFCTAIVAYAAESKAQDIVLVPGQEYVTGNWAPSVVLGDFNGDAAIDAAATAPESEGGILLYAGDGTGGFAEPVFHAIAGASVLHAGDLNDDGRLDLYVSTQDGGVSALGDGQGRFQTIPSAPRAELVAELTGDAFPDVIATRQGATCAACQEVVLHRGAGDGTFGAAETIALTTEAFGGFATADFDNDGSLDLAFDDPARQGLMIALNRGDGTFDTTQRGFRAVTTPHAAAGDTNGDDTADIVLTNPDGSVSLFAGHGDGTFEPSGEFPACGPGPCAQGSGLTIGDIDGDGMGDVIVSSTPWLVVLRGRTDGTLHAPQTFPASDFASTPSLGDLNGDGRPDLVVAAGDQADLTGLRGFFVYVNLTGPSVPPPGGDDDGDPDTLTWQRTINVEVDGNGVRKSMGCDGCFDGIATAEPALATDGAVEFTVVDPARILMAGLATADVANSPAALAYGLFVQGGGWVEVREQGAYRTDTRIAAGDRLRISTSDDVVAYAKNGEVFYTSTVAPAPPLHFHVFLAHIGAAIEDVRLSAAGSQPPQPPPANGRPTWTQSSNVLVSADVVRKTDGCDGCFDGFAVTDQVIAVEGGAVEFRIEDPSRLLIAGLTTEFGGTSPASIDYGLFVQGAGWVEVRESGAYRGDVRIEAGDTLRIGVDQGVVSYALNGAVFHTSTEPAVGDMVFVVVPASLDAAVVDVTIW